MCIRDRKYCFGRHGINTKETTTQGTKTFQTWFKIWEFGCLSKLCICLWDTGPICSKNCLLCHKLSNLMLLDRQQNGITLRLFISFKWFLQSSLLYKPWHCSPCWRLDLSGTSHRKSAGSHCQGKGLTFYIVVFKVLFSVYFPCTVEHKWVLSNWRVASLLNIQYL